MVVSFYIILLLVCHYTLDGRSPPIVKSIHEGSVDVINCQYASSNIAAIAVTLYM